MKFIKKFLFVASLGFLLLNACKKSGNLKDSLVAIPADAVSITAINMDNLMHKADFESVKNMEFYKAALAEAEKQNPAMAELMKDPMKSGIDLTKNIYIVQNYEIGQGGNNESDATILMSVADVNALQNMLQNAKLGTVETKENVKFIRHNQEKEEITEGGYKVNYNVNNLIAWNDKLMVVSNQPNDEFLRYFRIKQDESVAQNSNMKALMSAKHDIYTYLSFDKYADNINAKAAAGAMNLDPKALKGNYLTGYSDFENGAVISKSDFKINKEISQQWGILFKNSVKTDFSKYINGGNIGFALTLGLDMKGLKEIINANPQFRMMTKMGEGVYNFSIDDLVKALDGDIVIAASPTAQNDKWSGMMGFKMGDKEAVEKMMAVLVREQILVKENDNAYQFAGMAQAMSENYISDSKIVMKDNILFMGDNATVSSLDGKGSVNNDVKEVLNKNIFGMYINFDKIFANSEEMKGFEMVEMRTMINNKTGENVLKTRDSNENSLKSLMKAVNRWYLKNKAEEQKRQLESGSQQTKESI